MKIDIDAIIAKHEQALQGMQKRASEFDQSLDAQKRAQVNRQINDEKQKEANAIFRGVKTDRMPIYMVEVTPEMEDLQRQMRFYHSEVARLTKKLDDLRKIKLSGEYDRIIPIRRDNG